MLNFDVPEKYKNVDILTDSEFRKNVAEAYQRTLEGMGWSLNELDLLHQWAGLGPEWYTSDRRKELCRQAGIPILPRQYVRYPTHAIIDEFCWWSTPLQEKIVPWMNNSAQRTRSARWRAGSKRNKPKYNWTLKERGKK